MRCGIQIYLYFSDEPKDVSSQAKTKDRYGDILDIRRHKSDVKYITKSRPNIPMYKYCKPRTPAEIKADVLNSDRVKYRVEMVCY